MNESLTVRRQADMHTFADNTDLLQKCENGVYAIQYVYTNPKECKFVLTRAKMAAKSWTADETFQISGSTAIIKTFI